jgi:hypothetical protein
MLVDQFVALALAVGALNLAHLVAPCAVQDFFYLTGVNQPGVAVLQVQQPELPGGDPSCHFTLFIEAPDPDVRSSQL